MSKQPHVVLIEKVTSLIEEVSYHFEIKELRSKYEAELSRLKEDNFKLRTENFSLRNQLLAKCSEKVPSHSNDDEISHEKCTSAPNGLYEHENNCPQNIDTHPPKENTEKDIAISDNSNKLQAKEVEANAATKMNQKEMTTKGKPQSEDEDEIIILDSNQSSKKEKSRDWQSTLTFLSTLGAQRRINEFFRPPNQGCFNDNDIDISSDTDSQKPIPSEVEISAKFPPLPLSLIATEEATRHHHLHKQNTNTENKENETSSTLYTKEQKEPTFITTTTTTTTTTTATDNDEQKDYNIKTKHHPISEMINEKKVKRVGHRPTTTKKEKKITNQQHTEHNELQDKAVHKRRKKDCEKVVPTRSFDEMARLMNDDIPHSRQRKSSLEKVVGFTANKSDIPINSHPSEVRNFYKLNKTNKQMGIEDNEVTSEAIANKMYQQHRNEQSSYHLSAQSDGNYQKQHQNNEQNPLLRDSKDIQQGRFSESEQTPELQNSRNADQKSTLHQVGAKGHNCNDNASLTHQRQLEVPLLKSGRVFPSVEVVRKKELREQLPGKECPHCKRFYAAICDDEAMREHLVRCCSRHREKYSPPSTPQGYWDASFPDSQEPKRSEDSLIEDDNF